MWWHYCKFFTWGKRGQVAITVRGQSWRAKLEGNSIATLHSQGQIHCNKAQLFPASICCWLLYSILQKFWTPCYFILGTHSKQVLRVSCVWPYHLSDTWLNSQIIYFINEKLLCRKLLKKFVGALSRRLKICKSIGPLP